MQEILENMGEKLKLEGMSLKLNSNSLFNLLNSTSQLDKFQIEIASKWDEFKKLNQQRIIAKSYTTFFYLHFDDYFHTFLNEFCGFKATSLKLIQKEKVSIDNLFLEYRYALSQEEMRNFKEFGQNYGDIINGITSPTGYLYLIVSILGAILRRATKENFYVILDGAVIQEDENRHFLKFLIVIKDSKDSLFEYYYQMFLYYFLKHFKGIPENYYDKLLQGREKLYDLAIQEYPSAKEKLVDLLYYFYKKCNLLQNFSPLLDFFNFVCSRVEDSVFSKYDIIKQEFLINFDYTEAKKKAILRIFEFLDKSSTLYSTFQANNLPSSKSQFNLFLLYLKFYFGSGLDVLESGDLLFLPNKLREFKKQYNIDEKIALKVQKFVDHASILSTLNDVSSIINKIFNRHITGINYDFFKTFLRSLNSKLTIILEKENQVIAEDFGDEPFSFKNLVDHICRMLYVLIDKIFIRISPNQASKNFIDPRSRYIGKNIALRVLELFIFQDLNVSDDVWPDYVISMKKEELLRDLEPFKVDIPETYFYNVEDIIRFVVTYNFQSYSDTMLLEEWLINQIILPLNDFITKIQRKIKDPQNRDEIYHILETFFKKDIPSDEEELIEEIEFACKQLIPIWLQK
ncbi:MAG: hypothetical protein EU532_13690 [Promethearchaeota archaeon]|nr:MAG: hypothetical protein EU532_13690 [Candidatus Lokiarchaeota archaeon]